MNNKLSSVMSILIAIVVSVILTSILVEDKKEVKPKVITNFKIKYVEKELIKTSPHIVSLLQKALPGYAENSVIYSIPVTVTSYNPLESQCDDTPLINAWNKLVMPGQVALPQGMRTRLGLDKGQTILLAGYGMFTITDHMNRRYDEHNRVDIISFIPKWSAKFGIQRDIQMFWW